MHKESQPRPVQLEDALHPGLIDQDGRSARDVIEVITTHLLALHNIFPGELEYSPIQVITPQKHALGRNDTDFCWRVRIYVTCEPNLVAEAYPKKIGNFTVEVVQAEELDPTAEFAVSYTD